jgi:hypothetical protein
LTDARVLLLGAGGAAHAVIPELQSRVASVTVCARRDEEARRLADLTRAAWTPWGCDPGDVDIVVHLTRWGHGQLPNTQDESQWSWLPRPRWRDRPPLVLDAVYAHADLTCFEAMAIAQQSNFGCIWYNAFDLNSHFVFGSLLLSVTQGVIDHFVVKSSWLVMCTACSQSELRRSHN